MNDKQQQQRQKKSHYLQWVNNIPNEIGRLYKIYTSFDLNFICKTKCKKKKMTRKKNHIFVPLENIISMQNEMYENVLCLDVPFDSS